MLYRNLLVCALACTATVLKAQSNPDTVYTTERVPVITGLRLETPAVRSPVAGSRLKAADLLKARSGLGVFDPLQQLPGIWAMNPDNYAQDLRISIRGFGARAGFGIRGVRLFVDGIPESTPDGQAEVDIIDPGHLQNLEVLRSPAAGLYGNAAGGVLLLETGWPDTLSRYEASAVAGSWGLQRYQLRAGTSRGAWSTQGSIAWQKIEGYRENAAMEGSQINLKIQYRPAGKSTRFALLYAGVFSPVADDPGGLTHAQAEANPRQARPEALSYRTGESIGQHRLGLRLDGRKNALEWGGYAFAAVRSLDNRLPFRNGGMVELRRRYGGANLFAGVRTNLGPLDWRSRIGMEAAWQHDDRARFDNLTGTRGNQTLEQGEYFRNLGLYTVHDGAWGPATLLFSLRADLISQEVRDRFLEDDNQSGSRHYQRLSPMAGLSWRLAPRHHVYANLTSNFEAPALNELSNNPAGAGGFAALSPQRSRSVELGYKARLSRGFRTELALFRIDLEGEIVPFQVPEFPGRTFYRNAGQSRRQGMELEALWNIHARWSVVGSCTWNRFVYRNYIVNGTSYAGNRQPGVPDKFGLLELRWQSNQVFMALQSRFAGAIQANDANTEQAVAYWLASWRGSWTSRREGLELFAGVQNLFDQHYFANVQINAAGGRYYEPGAPRNFYIGIRISNRSPADG